jgi:ectoine hydroxylase-related dioxygenase (phytanoyl-CoA dioxygenase family)
MMIAASTDFAANGFVITEDVFTTAEMAALAASLPDNVAGQRNLQRESPAVRALATEPRLVELLAALGCTDAQPVRAVFFDKNPAHNWKVPWHQDLTIAVHARHEVVGYGPWSVKDGVPHVQPPPALLARMVTLRVHLDDCRADNGALRVRSGSHLHGRFSEEEILHTTVGDAGQICAVRGGGVLAMRPLLLHASSSARVPCHRRVIHLDFSPDQLPTPLEWFDTTPAVPEMGR